MATARLKPNIDDIHLFHEFCVATLRAFCAGWKQLSRFVLIPCICALTCKEINHSTVKLLRIEWLPATPTQEDGDWNAPDPLSGYAPVRPRRNHVRDTFFTPGRVPLYALDFLKRSLSQCRGSAVLSAL